jgi:hypothetical protein
MESKHFFKRMGLMCLMVVFLWSCNNDDQNDVVSFDRDEYSTYESNLMDHMRHFGSQIRANSALDLDDESLKSISSSYFNADEHASFIATIDNPETEPLTQVLQEKFDKLHAAASEYDDHAGYLTFLRAELATELINDGLVEGDKERLLNHIIHLRVTTRFLEEYQDLFDPVTPSGRLNNASSWLATGSCAVTVSGSSSSVLSTAGESAAIASIATGVTQAKTDCSSEVFLAAFKFFEGIQENPYCNSTTTCDTTNIYNVYSYGYIQADTIVKDSTPPVSSLSNYELPSGTLTMEITNGDLQQGPYIGTTSAGEYFSLTDCSGFVSYIISVADANAYQEIWDNRPLNAAHHLPYCPSAAQFASFQPKSGGLWTRIFGDDGQTDFSQIRAGDIIAWDEDDTDPDGDTGHVMVAAGSATYDSTGHYYTVKIFDSTLDKHKDDVRNGKKKGNDASGVGFGIIGLRVTVSELQSNFFPVDGNGGDPWFTHPNITILRYTPASTN